MDALGGGWFDTHCHLNMLEVEAADAVAEARRAGVAGMVNVGTDLSSSRRSVELAGMFDSVWAAVGVHPHDAKDFDEDALTEVAELAGHSRVVAVGEVGLDFYRDHSPRDAQARAFEMQLEVAKVLGLPVVLHIREAHEKAFEVLDKAGLGAGAVFHCFSAGPAEALRAVEMGGFISFAGNITYNKSDSIREAAKVTPQDRLLVETDAPFLAPVPHRGKPNAPAYAAEVGRALAKTLGRPEAEVAQITRQNAKTVFRLPK